MGSTCAWLPTMVRFLTTALGTQSWFAERSMDGRCSNELQRSVPRAKRWTERNEVIRGFARWLGFRRTGPFIDEAARSLINGLIRDGRLESHGSQIRHMG